MVDIAQRKLDYTSAIPFASEGGRVGLITCTRCGAALLLSMVEDSMTVHDDWHAAIDGREANE